MVLKKFLDKANQLSVTGSNTVAICLLIGLTIRPAEAFELNAGIGVTGEYSDNINLTEDDKESDTAIGIASQFLYSEQTAGVDSLVGGNLRYRKFLQGNSDESDELIPNIRGNLLLRLDPDRFLWTVDGRWRQVRRDQGDSDAPGNLENQFVIQTGPDYILPLSSVLDFQADARVRYLTNEDSDDDNVTFDGGLRLNYALGDNSSAAGNLEGRAIRYLEDESDDIENDDGNIVDAFVSYERQDAKIQSDFAIGASFANIENQDDETGLFLQVNVARELGQLSRGGIRAYLGYDSQGRTALTSRPTTSEDEGPNESRSANIFYEQRAEAFYETTRKRSSFAATLLARQRDFQGENRDERRLGATLTWSRELTRRSTGTLFGSAFVEDYQEDSTTDQLYRFGARLRHQFSQRILGGAEVGHRRRASDESGRDYNETRVLVFVGYQWSLGGGSPRGLSSPQIQSNF